MSDESRIGHVSHYFGKLHVAAIELTDGELAVGETIHFKGHTSDFTQKVASMQMDGRDVPNAGRGQSVGVRVDEHAREGDTVFKVDA